MENKELLKQYFGIDATSLEKMEGYESINFKVETAADNFVLKQYSHDQQTLESVEAENLVLLKLSELSPTAFPSPITTKENHLTYNDGTTISRLLSFVDGTFFDQCEQTPELLQSLGSFLAKMDSTLLDFQNTGIAARKLEWDLQYPELNKKYISYITSPTDKKLVDYFFLQFDQKVRPHLPELRKSIIHSDANPANVFVKNNKVSGIIDFGDTCYTPLINELAIAIAYSIMEQENPIDTACELIKGYCEVLAVEEQEIELLYYLIAMRWSVSVCKSAHAKIQNPDSKYITISEKASWKMLHQWITYNPLGVTDSFRKAAGFESKLKDTVEEDYKRRHTYFSKALSTSFSRPVKMVGAAFQYMYDANGNGYLDAYNNIPLVGHSHPKVVAAGQQQMAQLNTNTRYLSDQLDEYSERLLAKFPDSLNKVFFVNSGSAASDLAMRLSLAYTEKPNIMVMEHGYHGNTQMGISVSHYKYGGKGGKGKSGNILEAPLPDAYRGADGKEYAQKAIEKLDNVAAFVAEPIVGCGGQVPLADGFLKELYPAVRAQGGICISDEVQVGFGRLGETFWGFEAHGVVPDIVICGKPIGNGHPMAAVITTDEIASSFENGMEFFSSFGGNNVSCAIGLAVLNVLEEENLQQHALETGNYFKQLLGEIDSPYIGDVRGSGLFLGVEIVKDKSSKEHYNELAQKIKNELAQQRIILGTDGPHDSVIKTKPPLCFNKENAEQTTEAIAKVLKANN